MDKVGSGGGEGNGEVGEGLEGKEGEGLMAF